MSYEVVFYYHERLEEGGYNKEEIKELKKRVGKNYEDVTLNSLASFLLSQLARRDIFIFKYDVFEYKKELIKSKETKDGIILKGKKFSFDGNTIDFIEVEDQESIPLLNIHNGDNNKVNGNIALVKAKNPIKYVRLDTSDDRIFHEFKATGWKFTKGKDYPVYKEISKPNKFAQYLYLMNDDNGKEGYFDAIYFVNSKVFYKNDASDIKEKFDIINEDLTINQEPKLSFDDAWEENENFDIRSIRR